MLNKQFLTILASTFSAVSIAGTMGSVCAPMSTTVPCEFKQWDIGIQALYLKPVYSHNKTYFSTPPTQFKNVDNAWNWGYRLSSSYDFKTGNDISIDWTHYDVTTKSHAETTLPEFHINSLVPFSYNNDNRFDQVNLVLGQHVDFSQKQSTRFYGGFQYARISSGLANTDFAALGLPAGYYQLNNMMFNGVGPSIGVDYAYHIGLGFSLTANTASSILYGNSRNNLSSAVAPGLVISSSYASNKSIVPSLEEKLGLNYARTFAHGLLTIDGGYQALNYFNALPVIQTSQVGSSDFGLYGPYFGIHWLGQA